MTTVPSPERIFSLSCFEGFRLLRRYGERYPELHQAELVVLIENLEADGLSLDLDASTYLETIVPHDCSLEGQLFYQVCIEAVLVKHQPIWTRAMRQGRQRFINTLDRNYQDLFAAAGLAENPPSGYVVDWWDRVSGYARLFADQERVEQGRTAERLTLEHERKRLVGLGIDMEPGWPGLDDNFAGYDVLSYNPGQHAPVNLMIEVKSTRVSPLRFILTRNEWNNAEKSGDSYIFHLWDMTKDPPVLYVRSVSEVAQHIPTDAGKGEWQNVVVPVGSS